MLRGRLRREAAIYRHCLVGLAEAQCASILISISRLIWKIVDGFAARQGSLVRIFLNLCNLAPRRFCRLSWIVRISREPVATVRRFCGLPCLSASTFSALSAASRSRTCRLSSASLRSCSSWRSFSSSCSCTLSRVAFPSSSPRSLQT